MSVHFHPLTVKDIRRETAKCVSISFKIPEEHKSTFLYKHGQYLTIKSFINGQEVRRSYSICSSPLDDELRIAVKKVEAGVFSAYAHYQLQPGDVIEAMPPMGKFFTELHASNKKSYVAFAAGSGITPIISIIKTTLLTEPKSRFTLVYGNQSRHTIIFKEKLEALKNRFVNRFAIVHVLSREIMDTPLNSGRINKEKCELLFKSIIDIESTGDYFLCGPAEMIFTVKDFLQDKGVDKKKIHFELFTPVNIERKASTSTVASNYSGLQSNITIKLDGSSFDFNLGYNDENILNAALHHGADLPFACKGGVCSTCKAKLIKGNVEMDANYALEAEEIERGFILTCQSHPRSEKVVVDFDFR